jgi:hypothetical protein
MTIEMQNYQQDFFAIFRQGRTAPPRNTRTTRKSTNENKAEKSGAEKFEQEKTERTEIRDLALFSSIAPVRNLCFFRVRSVAPSAKVMNHRERRGRRENAELNASLCVLCG